MSASPLALWSAWQAACHRLWEAERSCGLANDPRKIPLYAAQTAARNTFDACHPLAQYVASGGGVPCANPHGAECGASIDAVSDWILTWWPNAASHRAATDEAMCAFGYFVARRLGRGQAVAS